MASILIVGAGLSGLACGLRLQRAGHDVEVLERAEVPGGRARTAPLVAGAETFVTGPGRRVFRSGDKNLRALVDFLGRTSTWVSLGGRDLAIVRDGGAVAELDASGPLGSLRGSSLGSRGRFVMFRASVDRARQRRLLDPWQPELAASLDRQNLASYLGVAGVGQTQDEPVAAALSFVLRSPTERVSDAAGLLWLERRAGAPSLVGLEGGIDGLARETAAQLRVRCGVEVTRVECESGGVRVRYRGGGRDRLALADAVVLAVPAPLVPVLCPRLSPDERGFLDGVRYAHGLEVSLALEAPLRLPAAMVALDSSRLGLSGLLDDTRVPGAAPEGRGLVRAVFSSSEALELRGEPEEGLVERVVEGIEAAGLGRVEPLASRVHRTPLATPQQRPGALVRLAAFHARRTRTPRLALAGDYLIGPHPEGAVTSGLRAAVDVVRALHDATTSPAPQRPAVDPNAETQVPGVTPPLAAAPLAPEALPPTRAPGAEGDPP